MNSVLFSFSLFPPCWPFHNKILSGLAFLNLGTSSTGDIVAVATAGEYVSASSAADGSRIPLTGQHRRARLRAHFSPIHLARLSTGARPSSYGGLKASAG